MGYTDIKTLGCSNEGGELCWFVNDVLMTDDQVLSWRKVEIQWPNGNRLHHKIRIARHTESNGTTSWDVLLSLKFHGQTVELSLFRNPDVRKHVQSIRWVDDGG